MIELYIRGENKNYSSNNLGNELYSDNIKRQIAVFENREIVLPKHVVNTIKNRKDKK